MIYDNIYISMKDLALVKYHDHYNKKLKNYLFV